MLHSASQEDVTAVLGSPAADWIVEPARVPGGLRSGLLMTRRTKCR